MDDHLSTFWLDGRHWGAPATALRIPGGHELTEDAGERDADAVRLGEARLVIGSTVACLIDHGDGRRVSLTATAVEPVDGRTRWGVEGPSGTAPPRHPEWVED